MDRRCLGDRYLEAEHWVGTHKHPSYHHHLLLPPAGVKGNAESAVLALGLPCRASTLSKSHQSPVDGTSSSLFPREVFDQRLQARSAADRQGGRRGGSHPQIGKARTHCGKPHANIWMKPEMEFSAYQSCAHSYLVLITTLVRWYWRM